MKKSTSITISLTLSCLSLPGAITFNSVNYGAPSADESDAFNRINDFRADPQNELYDMFVGQGYAGTKAVFDAALAAKNSYTSGEGWWQSNFGGSIVTSSMDFFATVPATLKNQFDALPAAGTLNPYTWSNNIGWAAHQYSVWVENDAGATPNPHAIPGAPSLGARFTEVGVNWGNVGENIARNWPLNTAQMHMGFAIDWGTGVDGIQSPPGHRNSMLSSTFEELGIGIVDLPSWNPGNYTQTQHFARTFSTDPIFYGYVTDCATGDENAGITVNVYDASGNLLGTTTTDARGGYTIEFAGGTPAYATYNGEQSTIALGTDGANFFLDAAIPEPSSTLLLALATLAPTLRRRR